MQYTLLREIFRMQYLSQNTVSPTYQTMKFINLCGDVIKLLNNEKQLLYSLCEKLLVEDIGGCCCRDFA